MIDALNQRMLRDGEPAGGEAEVGQEQARRMTRQGDGLKLDADPDKVRLRRPILHDEARRP